MHSVEDCDLPFCLSDRASEGVEQNKSRQERSDLMTEDLPADGGDNDSSLKLDLRGLDQPASPVTPRGASFAVDSARTLADIPDDDLLSASARSTAGNKLSEGAEPKLASATEQSDMAQVPPSPHPPSVISQSAGDNYSQDFSSAAAASQKPTQTDVSKHSPRDSEVSEEIVETAEDISEALSGDEMSASAVKSTREMSVASDRAASPSESAAASIVTMSAVAASHVAGKYLAVIQYWLHHINFKVANTNFHTVRSFPPACLHSSLHATHSFRLKNIYLLSAPFVCTSFVTHSFSVAAPKIWKSLHPSSASVHHS